MCKSRHTGRSACRAAPTASRISSLRTNPHSQPLVFELCDKSSPHWPLYTRHSTQAGRHCPLDTLGRASDNGATRAANTPNCTARSSWRYKAGPVPSDRPTLQGPHRQQRHVHAVEPQLLPDRASVLESRDEDDRIILLRTAFDCRHGSARLYGEGVGIGVRR